MQLEKTINIEVAQRRTGVILYAKQSDAKSRFYTVTFIADGKKVDLDGATSAMFRGEKPDGHSFAREAVLNEDGTVTIEVGGQVLAAPGYVECDVAAYQGDRILSSGNFTIKVEHVPLGEDTTDSDDDFSFLNQATRATEAANAAAEAADEAADEANDAAAAARAVVANILYIDAEGYICAEGGE